MKNLTLLLVLLLCSVSLSAQKYIETVHLKNGSIIHGVIIEQIPNESLRIQTKDGSQFVYQMDEISKITKEVSAGSAFGSSGISSNRYRGFVDLGYSFGVGDFAADRIEFSTSHGYQFTPYFYLGVGAGVNYFYEGDGVVSVPIFANPRLDIPTNSLVSPFIDVKIGYTVSEYVNGFYLSPSIGARFDLQNNKGINVSVGYTLQKADVYSSYYNYIYKEGLRAITLKVGFDF